jgi:hypothetical protein
MKECRGCGQVKPLTEYYKGRGMADGHVNHCKACKRSYQRDKSERLRGTDEWKSARARYARKRKLRDVYGITLEDYEAALERQNGQCAICGTSDPGRDSLFFPVDHDHATGDVRGLLCHACNLGVGNFADDPERLIAAAAYLLSSRNLFEVSF